MSLPVDSIVDPFWSRKIRKSFGDKDVSYFININPNFEEQYRSESRFVRNFFAKVSSLTGVTFPEDREPDLLIDFVPSKKNSIGLNGYTSMRHGKALVRIKHGKSGYLIGNFKQVVAHELLHVLGLSHPYGNGSYAGVTTTDTLMSYNDTDPGYNGLTTLDIAALKQVWL